MITNSPNLLLCERLRSKLELLLVWGLLLPVLSGQSLWSAICDPNILTQMPRCLMGGHETSVRVKITTHITLGPDDQVIAFMPFSLPGSRKLALSTRNPSVLD